MKRLLLAMLLVGTFTTPAAALVPTQIGGTRCQSPVTIANLPTNIGAGQQACIVTDGATASDCTTGGGSSILWCCDDGATWTSCGSGGGDNAKTLCGDDVVLMGQDTTTCSDPILETELDSIAELDTQIGTTGTADSSTFLRGDNAWATPSGAGDVTAVGDCTTAACLTADGTGNSIEFEGSTADAYETSLTAADTTSSDKTITLPDETGTVCTTGSICSGTVTYEADAHITEHEENGADEMKGESLGTACTVSEGVVSDGAGGLDCTAAKVIQGSTGSTDNALVRADGTGTITLQSTGNTVDDSDNMTMAGDVKMGGNSVTNADSVTTTCTPASNDCDLTLRDNSGTPAAPSAGYTKLYSNGGEIYKQDSADGASIQLLDADDKTGADAGIVSGTAGSSGQRAQWNADGDLVDGGRREIRLALFSKNNIAQGTTDGLMSEGGGLNPMVTMPLAGTVTMISCSTATNADSAAPQAMTGTPTVVNMELYKNNADATDTDCAYETSGDTDCVASGLTTTFAVADELDLRYTTAADASPTGSAELGCSVWGYFD